MINRKSKEEFDFLANFRCFCLLAAGKDICPTRLGWHQRASTALNVKRNTPAVGKEE